MATTGSIKSFFSVSSVLSPSIWRLQSMQYYVNNGDIWCDHQQQLAAFPFSSSSPPPPGLAELADYCSSDLNLSPLSWEEEEEATRSAACYLPSPMFPAADDLPPFPPTADDDVLMPDLEPFLQALGNELVVDNGAAPILPVAMDHPIETTTQQPLQINDRHDDDGSLSGGYDETAAAEQQRCAFARPPAVEKKKKKRGDGPAAGGRSLQHVGLDELRRYFYMPMTKAAQELNVGTTALKKRCRELGVARWPHRKMKSLRSLISNLQEMGNGMSLPPLEAVQEELEVCCAMMEQNPGIELSESTKKLRQACFKESYNRRRFVDAATTTVSMLEYGQCCSYYPFSSFSHQQFSSYHNT